MRKREMTSEQLKSRSVFIKNLGQAGWVGTGVNELFDSGDYVSEEAQMEHNSKKMTLIAEFSAEKESLLLYLDAPDGRQASFTIQCMMNLPDVLAVIVSFQDQISPDNFRSYISKIINVCMNVFVDTPQGLQQLTKD